jgi:predicted PurR-regulated permease PerM
VLLWLIGVEFAFLWGLLAFLLSYIPYIGLVLEAIPAVLLAWIQFGLGPALLVIAGYGILNIVAENVVSPNLMGQGLKLSILTVFLSLILWGWLLGFMGTLLAAPLTVLLKVILDSSDETRWLAIVLGSDVPVVATVAAATTEESER